MVCATAGWLHTGAACKNLREKQTSPVSQDLATAGHSHVQLQAVNIEKCFISSPLRQTAAEQGLDVSTEFQAQRLSS